MLGPVIGLISLLAGCGSHVYHQVRPDDTLYSIGWLYSQDYRQVALWNGIEAPYVIHAGDWLRVAPPSGAAVVRTLSPVAPAPATPAPADYNSASSLKGGTSVPLPPPSPPAIAPKSVMTESPEYVSRVELSWVWPVKGRVVAKFNSASAANQGIDIAAPLGTAVHAAAAGKVVYSGNGLKGYGNLVIIKHNDKYLSAYGHNQKILVVDGAVVGQGDVIAYVGSSEAERAQLHFQVRIDGKPVDPLRYLP